MADKNLTVKEKYQKPSAVPVEKTYGEKMHHFIFDTLINLWATLAISGLFVFWVKHSNVPLPKTLFQGKLPRDFHAWTQERFQGLSLLKVFPENARAKVGEIMADALSINLPGTVTILPSAWLGAKFKTPIVEWLDKKHYGQNAEDDPHIAERHAIIEREHKPTILGATFARMGSMTASVLTGFAIGAPDNLVKQWGKNNPALKTFPGIDHYAGRAGTAVGGTIAKGAPAVDRAVTGAFKKWWEVDWEPGQGAGVYNNVLQDWAKWTSLDVMYTLVTSSTIQPFIKLLSHVPFMSYQEKPRHKSPEEIRRMASMPLQETYERAENRSTHPQTRVGRIENYSTVNAPRSTEIGAAG